MRRGESSGLQVILPHRLGQPGQPVRAQETEVRVDGVVQTQLRRPLLPLLLPELRASSSDQEREILRSQETRLPQPRPGQLPRVLLEQG